MFFPKVFQTLDTYRFAPTKTFDNLLLGSYAVGLDRILRQRAENFQTVFRRNFH